MRPTAIFMGTPEIAVPALQLLAQQADVRLVISQPDRPAGRGLALTPSPVTGAAMALGLPLWRPETLRGAESDARLHGIDLFVVMAYGEILRRPVLALPKACINLHASLLPRWRGASPLQACLRAGDSETGVSVMEMVPALDAGPVYLTEQFPLSPTTTLPALHDRMAAVAATALARFLAAWPGIAAHPQDDTLATSCRKLTRDDGQIDWSQPADAIERQVRAYTPAPGCWAAGDTGPIRILAVNIADHAGLACGEVLCTHDSRLIIGCGTGAIEVLRLQAPGRKAMTAADFLRGNTPPSRLR